MLQEQFYKRAHFNLSLEICVIMQVWRWSKLCCLLWCLAGATRILGQEPPQSCCRAPHQAKHPGELCAPFSPPPLASSFPHWDVFKCPAPAVGALERSPLVLDSEVLCPPVCHPSIRCSPSPSDFPRSVARPYGISNGHFGPAA